MAEVQTVAERGTDKQCRQRQLDRGGRGRDRASKGVGGADDEQRGKSRVKVCRCSV